MSLSSIIESLLFASDKPLSVKQLAELTGSSNEPIRTEIKALIERYAEQGIQLAEVGAGYQLRTHPDNANWVKKLLAGRPPRLTRAMLETLAICAYRQPITRPEIEEIRGVSVSTHLHAASRPDLAKRRSVTGRIAERLIHRVPESAAADSCARWSRLLSLASLGRSLLVPFCSRSLDRRPRRSRRFLLVASSSTFC